jgi:hypothetical protein
MSVDQRLRNGMHRSAEAIRPSVPAAIHAVEVRVRRRRRAVRVAWVAAVGVIIAVTAVATPAVLNRVADAPMVLTPADSLTALAGIWLNDADQEQPILLLRLSPDGTFALDDRGLLDVDPAATGTYRLGGDTLSLLVTGGPNCPAGSTWTWRTNVLADGRLRTVLADSACGFRAQTVWTWTRVSPWSPAAASIIADRTEGPGTPVRTPLVLRGVWLREGSGQLLRVSGDGTYALDDGGQLAEDPDDTGSVEVTNVGSVVLTSGSTSRVCAAGDHTTWTDVQRFGDRVLRGVVGDDTCSDRTGTTVTWIRMSP